MRNSRASDGSHSLRRRVDNAYILPIAKRESSAAMTPEYVPKAGAEVPMILSMTGFAAVAAELPGASLAVELRSVNHRYLDLTLRLPDELRGLETALRERIAAELKRGKVECRVALAARRRAPADGRRSGRVAEVAEAAAAVRAARPAPRRCPSPRSCAGPA